jgi:PBP1b-binding outer membrane lipoprotein LpoB
MRTHLRSFSALALGAFLLAACNQGKSPDQVAAEVAKAQDKANAELSRAELHADKDVAKAAGKVDDKLTDLNNDAATDAYKVALAKADGDHKVALAQCDSMSGDAQKSCRNQANADFDAAKANAKAAEQSLKQ